MSEIKINKCTLSDAELIKSCAEQISKMCKTGGSSFRMSVPVDLNSDTDILLSELVDRFREMVDANISNVEQMSKTLKELEQGYISADNAEAKILDLFAKDSERKDESQALQEAVKDIVFPVRYDDFSGNVVDDVDLAIFKMSNVLSKYKREVIYMHLTHCINKLNNLK